MEVFKIRDVLEGPDKNVRYAENSHHKIENICSLVKITGQPHSYQLYDHFDDKSEHKKEVYNLQTIHQNLVKRRISVETQ